PFVVGADVRPGGGRRVGGHADAVAAAQGNALRALLATLPADGDSYLDPHGQRPVVAVTVQVWTPTGRRLVKAGPVGALTAVAATAVAARTRRRLAAGLLGGTAGAGWWSRAAARVVAAHAASPGPGRRSRTTSSCWSSRYGSPPAMAARTFFCWKNEAWETSRPWRTPAMSAAHSSCSRSPAERPAATTMPGMSTSSPCRRYGRAVTATMPPGRRIAAQPVRIWVNPSASSLGSR